MSGTPSGIGMEISEGCEEKSTFGVDPNNIEIPEAIPDEPKYRPDQTDILMERTLQLPDAILAHERKLMALNRKDDAIKKRMEEIKNKIYINVANEKGADKPRYQDQRSIEIETNKRIEIKTIYQSLQAEIYNKVSKEEDKEGVKKYKNEPARQAEVTTRMLKHPDYIKLKQEVIQYVAKENDPGKLIFTNEKSREFEVTTRLQSHTEYKLLIADETDVVNDTHQTKAQIYFLRGEFKALEIVTELLKIKLRIM